MESVSAHVFQTDSRCTPAEHFQKLAHSLGYLNFALHLLIATDSIGWAAFIFYVGLAPRVRSNYSL